MRTPGDRECAQEKAESIRDTSYRISVFVDERTLKFVFEIKI